VSGGVIVPDGHVGAGDRGQLDGAGETLVTLGVIVLEADLELDRLEEVALLGLVGVLKELRDLRPDISCDGGLARPSLSRKFVVVVVVVQNVFSAGATKTPTRVAVTVSDGNARRNIVR